MNVKVIENLSLLTPLAFGHLSTDITENCLCPKDVKLHPIPRVEISLIEVYLKGQGNLPLRSVNRPKRATVGFYGCEKVKKIV